MPVICGSFSGAQVGASWRLAFATQWLGHAGFEGRFKQTATRFSRSGDPEVNLTLAVIGGVKVQRGQVLIFNHALQFGRWEGRPQEQRSNAGGGHATHGGYLAATSLTPNGVAQDLKPDYCSAGSRTGEIWPVQVNRSAI
jgi:hypothetical protein